MEFSEFGFHPALNMGIRKSGYQTPTPIQQQAMPAVLKGQDVMGLAQTGTGKTAAFALPILQRLMVGPKRRLRALVLAPTRELATQIDEAVNTLGRETGLQSTTIFGGVGIRPQLEKLKRGVDIVVACPGRLLDHIGQGSVDLSGIEVLVLDEADQMFDMGFLPDIRKILQKLPRQRQTLLFSATMPEAIRGLARDILVNPVTVQVGQTAPAETVTHAIYPVAQHLKTPLLLDLLRDTSASVLVFTRTKHRAKRLGEQLTKAGHSAASLQGNLSQNRRQEAMEGFRSGTFRILVATDIAARGIDVSQISHVINYDIPATPELYVHRIGRTGRAERTGDAFTLVSPEDAPLVKAIERQLGAALERRTLPAFDYAAQSKDGGKAEFQRPPRPGQRRQQAGSGPAARSQTRPTTTGRPQGQRPKAARPGLQQGRPR